MADPGAAELVPLPFVEAIAWARARQVVLPEAYYGKLQGLARAQAFTIAGLTSLDQLQQVAGSLTRVLESGETFRDWQKRVASGDVPLELGPAQLETIFRNNIQQSYNRGRYEQQAANLATHPFYMYDAVNDSRTRPSHAAMDGHVAPADDAVWETWTPACGHRCRCRRIALTEKQAARYREQDAQHQADPEAAAERASAIISGPDKGWGYDISRDPKAGLKRAIEQRQAQCGSGQMATLLARPRGGCLNEAGRLLQDLRRDLDKEIVVQARDLTQAHLGVAAALAESAERFQTLWRSPADYHGHLAKRLERGDVRDAADYRLRIAMALDEASLLLVSTAAGHPAQIAVESGQWAIIYRDDTIATAYPKKDGRESFIARRRRLGWSIAEVPIDDDIRALLRQLSTHYGRL